MNVAEIAQEYSRQVYPDEPITLVKGEAMSTKFEGMLQRNPNRPNEWGIFYNSAIQSKGRQNFTLGHELGHYLLHRSIAPDGIQCTTRDMLDWKSDYAQIEAQANTFSSFLLMPLDDFRQQIDHQKASIDLMQHLSDRYEVSLTAAILKWLSITDQRAMIVVGKDGFIDWSWGSTKLFASGVFFRGRSEVIPLPEKSLAAREDMSFDNETGIRHPAGVWNETEEVTEMTIFAEIYDMTISLLLYPKFAPPRVWKDRESTQ